LRSLRRQYCDEHRNGSLAPENTATYTYSGALHISELLDNSLLAELRKAAREKKDRFQKETITIAAALRPAEKKLLQSILESAGLQDNILPICEEDDFTGLAGEKIFSIILDEFRRGRRVTFEGLSRRLESGEDQSFIARLAVEKLPEEPLPEKAENWLNTLRMERLEARKKRIRDEIAIAEERKNDEARDRLYFESVAIDRELKRLSFG